MTSRTLRNSQEMTRRAVCQSAVGVGGWALASLLNPTPVKASPAPRAKRIIYLFMHGGPSQMDLFDYKPQLQKQHGRELPASVRGEQRLTGMTSQQKEKPIASSLFKFRQHGESGAWISELLPHLARRADDLSVVRSLHTEAINHDPAVTMLQTGHQLPGRPSFGAWASYGLGSENSELPAFLVMVSDGSAARPTDPLYARLWGSGFLPSNHQGVSLRRSGDPVLYLSNPPGMDARNRRDQLNVAAALNRLQSDRWATGAIDAAIEKYEMAFRMQTSVPDLVDLRDESETTLASYGPQATQAGSFAHNCLLARRMVERGVRFVQLYHRGWDQHYNLPSDLRLQCQDVDQPSAALLADLKQRGLLEDTLVVWGGEFGRTTYTQGKLTANNYGRDHHGRCFTMWLAGGGIRPGTQYGATDEFCYNIAADPVHVHDLNATLLHLLGVDHTRLTYRHQGRDYRLTDVHGRVVQGLIT